MADFCNKTQFRNLGEHDLSKEKLLRWLRDNLKESWLAANEIPPPREGQSCAAAAKKLSLDDMLAVYDRSIYEIDNLIPHVQEATIGWERGDDGVALKEEFARFGLGSSAVSSNYASMKDFDSEADAGEYGSDNGSDDAQRLADVGEDERAEHSDDDGEQEGGGVVDFIGAASFDGQKDGYTFLTREGRTGYFRDAAGEAGEAREARAGRLDAAPEPEPEPELSAEEQAARQASLDQAAMEIELTFRYISEEKRSEIRAKLLKMTEFERKAALARLRLKREEAKGELLAQRAALGGFFAVRIRSETHPSRETCVCTHLH